MTIPADAKALLSGNGLKWALVALIDTALFYIIANMYAQGEILFAMTLLVLTALGTWIFTSRNTYSYRYIYPCLLGIILFIIFPLLYTFNIAFTNYGSANILTLERVKEIHLQKQVSSGDDAFKLALYQNDTTHQLVLTDKSDSSTIFTTAPFVLQDIATEVVATADNAADGKKLSMRDVIKQRSALSILSVTLENGNRLVMTSLREFGVMEPKYREGENNELVDNQTGEILRPDMETGFYVTEAGEQLSPGFSVYVGGENFERLVEDEGIRQPFIKIFIWTLTFSTLTVLFTVVIGLLLATLMEWEPLKERGVYRILLILPYAVPAFISILIFKGLFNQNFGEINIILEALFGIRPELFTNPFMAKAMILIVNTWLGCPYMMIVCTGLMKAIPEDLYEASAIDGTNPIHNLIYITLPNLIKPLMPLLIASYTESACY